MIKDVDKRIKRFLAQIRLPFRGGVLGLNTATDVAMLQVSGMASENVPNVELFQQFGFASGVPGDCQVIVVPLSGKTSKAVVVATSGGGAAYKNLAAGETVIYNGFGSSVLLKADGSIQVNAAHDLVLHSGGNVHISSATPVFVDAPDLFINGKSFNNHEHSNVASGHNNSGGVV